MRKSVIPSRMKYGVYRSPHIFYLTVVQGRFLALLKMTIREEGLYAAKMPPQPCPPLFLQNAPIPLEKNALEITIPHRYCLLFHTAKHRAAARWISLKIKGFPLIFYKFEEKW